MIFNSKKKSSTFKSLSSTNFDQMIQENTISFVIVSVSAFVTCYLENICLNISCERQIRKAK